MKENRTEELVASAVAVLVLWLCRVVFEPAVAIFKFLFL